MKQKSKMSETCLCSDGIKSFLAFLRQSETELHIFEAIWKEKDQETQDIQHYLELQPCTYHERAKLATTLVDIRNQRRVAKDRSEELELVEKWYSENQKVISDLQKLLGEVRKIEKRHTNRQYMNRTDIVEQTIGHK